MSAGAPLDGLRVAEVSLGISAVGAGLAVSLPGSLLRDFGAEVTRVQSREAATIDAGVEFNRVWNRGKEVVEVEHDDPARAAATVAAIAREVDVLIVAGSEDLVERAGLQYHDLAQRNPRLVVVRIRPSSNALGALPDLELLVQARAGLQTQIRSNRGGGPAFGDLAVGSAGAGFSAAVGALAGLYQRQVTGRGGWAETSLYDGLQAMLPMIIGRVEHHSPSTTLLWQNQGPAEALTYKCADGEYVQLWFGAKGAYEQFLEHMGDPPSEEGYNADMASGALVERGLRWAQRFATQDRDWWMDFLAGHNFRCEPVWRPGEAFRDAHVREVGLAVEHHDPDLGDLSVLGPVVQVSPTGAGQRPEMPAAVDGAAPLDGVRVLDLSAYLAGPVGALVLAELGADVVKVEPLSGDVHRNMEPMFAAGQRGKRAVALDLKAPDAPAVLERLFRWADVVHQNSRVGLAERLGYDEATVRRANPDVVYSFASGFGAHGPRALLPANDQLMQALAGIEGPQAGEGQQPRFLVWGAIDVAGGWVSACGMLAGLYARRERGGGQSVASSLLGAALALKSGAFLAGERAVGGPSLDADQTGYGAAYRIYQGADDAWFAVATPDVASWRALREVVRLEGLPDTPPALRVDAGGTQPEEALLAKAFRAKDAASWVRDLRAASVPVELVQELDRTAFSAGFVDDPVNRQLGRIVSYTWGARGRVDQPCFPPRLGPGPRHRGRAGIAGLGEHTADVLADLGYDAAQRAALAESGTVAATPS